MKRLVLVAMTALVAVLMATDGSEAGIFRRGRTFYRRPSNMTYAKPAPTSGATTVRAEGHTEATGPGTNVDATPHKAPPHNGGTATTPPKKVGKRVEGHTEGTGTGTAVDPN